MIRYVHETQNAGILCLCMEFKISTHFKPAGDQPQAIEKLVAGIRTGHRYQTLLGVTGSGKTFTIANVIERIQRPTLVIAHNKTLAAQLCNEFREFFPHDAVEYFVSYYDYYQPEAYLPSTDTYIEKEAQINDEIDRLRHSATQALLSRRDVIVVASVSCIYNIGSPKQYEAELIHIPVGEEIERSAFMHRLIDMGYVRTSGVVERGQFRVRGEIIEIMPSSGEDIYRIEVDKNTVAHIVAIDPILRKEKALPKDLWIFPARHFMMDKSIKERAIQHILTELKERIAYFKKHELFLEAERIERRTKYDMEMIREIGYCTGIENYSRYFESRAPGDPPHTLLSYFPHDFLTVIDESHVTIPQLYGMHQGDRARKKALIDNGFRLESAYDNRPLNFGEFSKFVHQCVCTSATPSEFEYKESTQIVEQIIRPTGLVDPKITVRPIVGSNQKNKTLSQIDDVLQEVITRAQKKERTIITTLTKKQAEDLTEFLREKNIKARYLHSDVETIDRIKILVEFRKGSFDCLVGVNLLREGLDLPEVTLVAIFDADKEGFLRSETSLIQTIGRAARNVQGEVILYADVMTGSITRAMAETNRRREKQIAYNTRHGITPQTIKKKIRDITEVWGIKEKDAEHILQIELNPEYGKRKLKKSDIEKIITAKEQQMRNAARDLEFELAAVLRDEIKLLRKKL